MANPGPYDHAHGIKAHIMFKLSPGVDIDDAFNKIKAAKPGQGKDPGKRFVVIPRGLHVTLGEMDMIADVHCAWTNPKGRETRVIGEWVNTLRKLKSAGRLVLESSSTNVCMEWP